MPPQDDSSLDQLQKKLYSPNVDMTRAAARPARPVAPHDVPHAWQEPAMPAKPRKKRSLALTFFIGAGLFFVAAIAIAAYLIISGDRSVSTNNVSIVTTGPTTIGAGDTVPLSITIQNQNPADLTGVDFSVTFPEGTRSADDVTQPYPRYDEQIDSIPAGGKLERSVKAVVFGEEGQIIDIPIQLTYHTAGSNAVFVKQATYELTVSTAPISITVTSLDQTVAGQPYSLDVAVRSNATQPIQNAVVQADYPFGFTETSATPSDVNGTFALGTLNPGQTTTIHIKGTLTGEDSGSRTFRFTAGTASASGALSVTYTTQEQQVTLAAPFLNVAVTINGADADGAVVSPGSQVHANVAWTNTLGVNVNDARIQVQLQGAAIDPSTVQADRGFYQSSNETVMFDSDTDPSLSSLAPGASGVGSFTFNVQPNAGGSTNTSSIGLVVSIAGNRTDSSNVPQQVSASATKTIKIAGNMNIGTAVEHNAGPFTNNGPVPPTANQPTTYTVVWKASAASAVAGTKAVATVPSYVNYVGTVSPAGSPITFDSSTRKITWNIGDLGAGGTAQVAFQVSITPSTSQHATVPTLVAAPVMTAFDRFAGSSRSTTGSAATTETPGDPGYKPGNGQVQ